MAADFLVTVGADIKEYLKSLGTAEKIADSTASEIVKKLSLISKTSGSMGGAVAKGSNQAAFALTNLGRVAQDAPFGFIGIQNNLNPLLESFQRLKAETGTTGGALKALGSALTGPAGIGIALAVVSSAITFYTMWQQKAKKATNDTTDANKSFVDSLDGLNAARLKGEQDGQKELVRLNLLYKATQDTTISLQDRNKAYDELISKYPKFFTEAEREKTLLGQNTTAYNELTTAILAAAQAKAAEDRISSNTNRQLENRYKIVAEQKKQVELQKEIAKLQLEATPDDANVDIGRSGSISADIDLYQAQQKLAESQKNVNNLLTDSNLLRRENIELSKEAIKNEQEAGFKEKSTLDDKVKKQKELNDLKRNENPITGDIRKAGLPPLTLTTDSMNTLKPLQLAAFAQADLKKRSQEATEALKQEEETVNNLTGAFGQGLTGAFQSALSGTQSFVSAMGQFLGQLITRLIAAAAAAAILAVILSAVGFGAGLGGASSAFGSFKNLFGSFSGVKLAEGGITTGPTRALIGEGREKEAVMPLSKLQSFVNSNSGGWKNGEIVGVLQGSNQLLQIRRAEQQKERIG